MALCFSVLALVLAFNDDNAVLGLMAANIGLLGGAFLTLHRLDRNRV